MRAYLTLLFVYLLSSCGYDIGASSAYAVAGPDLILDGVEHTLPTGIDYGEWLSDNSRLQGGAWHHAVLIGEHTTDHGIDLTNVRQGVVIDATRLRLTIEGTNAVDMVGATGIRWEGGYIIGGTGAQTGFLMARRAPNEAAGKHQLNNLEVVGAFADAAVAVISSESNRFSMPRLENTDGICLLFSDPENHHGTSSDFETMATNSTATNALVDSLRCKSKGNPYDASGNPLNTGAIYIDGFDRVHLAGQTYTNSNLPALHVSVAGSGIASLTVDDLIWYPVNTFPEDIVRLSGPYLNGLVSVHINVSRGYIDGGYVFRVDGTNPTTPGLDFVRAFFQHHEGDGPGWDMNDPDWDNSTFQASEIWDRDSRRAL